MLRQIPGCGKHTGEGRCLPGRLPVEQVEAPVVAPDDPAAAGREVGLAQELESELATDRVRWRVDSHRVGVHEAVEPFGARDLQQLPGRQVRGAPSLEVWDDGPSRLPD